VITCLFFVPHTPIRSQVPIPSWIFQESDAQELIRMNLESFDLQSVIGKGKFGLVYYAQNKSTAKFLAIKFISKKILYETKGRERTQQVRNIVLSDDL
jgi:serine/threonine protein kinase